MLLPLSLNLHVLLWITATIYRPSHIHLYGAIRISLYGWRLYSTEFFNTGTLPATCLLQCLLLYSIISYLFHFWNFLHPTIQLPSYCSGLFVCRIQLEEENVNTYVHSDRSCVWLAQCLLTTKPIFCQNATNIQNELVEILLTSLLRSS